MKLDYESGQLYLDLAEARRFREAAMLAKRLAKDRSGAEVTELTSLAFDLEAAVARYYVGTGDTKPATGFARSAQQRRGPGRPKKRR